MHISTKVLLVVLATFLVGAAAWHVVDYRRAKKHRERRLAREAREREAAQATGTDDVVVDVEMIEGEPVYVIDVEGTEVRDGAE